MHKPSLENLFISNCAICQLLLGAKTSPHIVTHLLSDNATGDPAALNVTIGLCHKHKDVWVSCLAVRSAVQPELKPKPNLRVVE
jgi:hypothetical protein